MLHYFSSTSVVEANQYRFCLIILNCFNDLSFSHRSAFISLFFCFQNVLIFFFSDNRYIDEVLIQDQYMSINDGDQFDSYFILV